MQTTSATYKQIISGQYFVETSVCIGATAQDVSDPDTGYRENVLLSVKQERNVFSSNLPNVGCCVASEIDIRMINPSELIPRKARIAIYVRAVSDDRTLTSEWLPKGTFFVDTRAKTNNSDRLDILTIHGYDSMILAEQDYSSTLQFPSTTLLVAQDIATKMGVSINSDSLAILTNNPYAVQLPVQYTCREILGYIGAMYAGNWIIDDFGELRLIRLNDIPPETYYLIDENNAHILFGGDRIVIWGD